VNSRICVVGLRGIPAVIGGVETHCEELLPRVCALAPDLKVEVLGRRGFIAPGGYDFRRVWVRALPAPANRGTEAIVSTFVALLYARTRTRARVVHIHAIGPALLAPLARALGMRVIMTHHGADYDRSKWGPFAKFVLRAGERAGLSFADEIIAVAPSLASELRRRFPRSAGRIRYIPNGAPALEEGASGDEILGRFGLTPKGYILAVGRLVPEKGFDYLVRAFGRSGTARQLVIVGSDIHGSAYSKQLLGAASPAIRFIGNQPRPVLRRLYEQTDLFVLPSMHEGLPIAALEAASCGAPMLLSDIPANKDLGLPDGNYFPAGDERLLAECLQRPGEDFAYDADGVKSRFDWDSIALRTAEVYRSVAAAAPG
jgi:glycosyltransferase involved in cell wall biosynthesis